MKQLTQQLKSGKMEILEVPFPLLEEKQILVRNYFSVISSGTEGKTVTDARKGYIAKARSRQKEVKQIIEMIKANGLKSTYDFVMNKLDAPSALGYSCAGEVIAVGEKITGFKVGDFVACGGNSASHADVVSIPQYLAVKLPQHVDLKEAAFTTLGAISLQGIRQAELKVGENCLIIGMGLIGQITAKILQTSGIKVVGIDVSDSSVNQSKKNGIKYVYPRGQNGIEEVLRAFSAGFGLDSVIITAGTNSLDPIEFAGKIARKKAKIVIVGAVPTGFERENFYKKELDVRMSMSYGPGRGDLNYEDKGIDYPVGYVRWTENRNMQAFVDLLESGKLYISDLISHVFPLEDVEKAYNLIVSKEEEFNGILIQYDSEIPKSKINFKTGVFQKSSTNIGLIGAGNFAQGILLPKMRGLFQFGGIVTNKGNISKYVADKYGFSFASDNPNDLFQDESISTIFITTRHDSHAKYVLKGIESHKNIFVEKPLALNERELEEIKTAYHKLLEKNIFKHIVVGFNRRFSAAIEYVKKTFGENQAKSINIRVNAGDLPFEHWVNDPEIGGGRIIGEACHFIDLATFIAGSKIKTVSAEALNKANGLISSVSISLGFDNGSIASISYFSNGNKLVSKEFIEIFCGGTIVQIDDFKSVKIHGKNKKIIKFRSQDKGHIKEMELFHHSIKHGLDPIISFEESYRSTLATFKVVQSIRETRKIFLED